MTLTFGTDGVRGVANDELTPEFAMALGRAAALVLAGDCIIVGRDTRRSGPMLEAAFAAGVNSEGVSVELLGVIPTPGVAFACQQRGAAGAVISASHNPFGDNGIKLFAPGGLKLPDDVESAIEARFANLPSDRPLDGAVGTWVSSDIVPIYIEHLCESSGRLDGLKVVLDCANGAASVVGPEVFRRLGADVVVIHDEPDGVNINARCGATHPHDLSAAVVAHGAHAGLAFDGDADRLIAVDHTGTIVDGDHLIAICALDLHARDLLRNDTVVVTVMTNLGFRIGMETAGIKVVETAVGDRYVLEALHSGDHSLGGEQSGHVIFRDRASTGDGVLTGLALIDVVRRSGRSLAELAASAMTRLPQVLLNVRVRRRDPDIAGKLAAEIAAAEGRMHGLGRVLIRPSGTEPLIRVMVEAQDMAVAEREASQLAAAAEAACR